MVLSEGALALIAILIYVAFVLVISWCLCSANKKKDNQIEKDEKLNRKIK